MAGNHEKTFTFDNSTTSDEIACAGGIAELESSVDLGDIQIWKNGKPYQKADGTALEITMDNAAGGAGAIVKLNPGDLRFNGKISFVAGSSKTGTITARFEI